MGLAHASGQTLFVALAAPGDRVRVRLRQVRGKVAFAAIEEIVAPSPARGVPPCPHFGRCGGCDFQQMTYDAQLAAKIEIIRDCLRRIARVESPGDIPIVASPSAWRYRSRAQWQYDSTRMHLGYFARGSHDVCDVIECPVVVPELQKLLTDLRAEMSADCLTENISELQAVAGDSGAVTLTPPVWDTIATDAVRNIGGERYRFNAEYFFQINHELLGPLVEEAIKDARGESALDLYCGVGLFTLPLARRLARIVGVEGNRAACEYVRLNLADAGLTNARVEVAGVGEWLRENARNLAAVDFLLLDPPRAGADGGAAEGIVALRPRRISYVSCDPATLARDLKVFLGHGYELSSVVAFDMFPQTHHVETVVHLSASRQS
jgi:tRNA/tmRNA/rRNA uracil-C5-methylase (TrmA/RlmC/RlmD family)